jgi:hypothetical protein
MFVCLQLAIVQNLCADLAKRRNFTKPSQQQSAHFHLSPTPHNV